MIYEDRVKFPSGMKALGEWIHNQDVPGKGKIMKYGMYTCRGTWQVHTRNSRDTLDFQGCPRENLLVVCSQCSTQLYKGPGSHGHVKGDAQWLAGAGADYLKKDSCCGRQDHPSAFSDYAEMRVRTPSKRHRNRDSWVRC